MAATSTLNSTSKFIRLSFDIIIYYIFEMYKYNTSIKLSINTYKISIKYTISFYNIGIEIKKSFYFIFIFSFGGFNQQNKMTIWRDLFISFLN